MGHLKEAWKLWKKLAGGAVGAAAWLLLTFLYIALVVPMRLFGCFGKERRAEKSRWSRLEGLTSTLEEAGRQY